MRKRDPEQADIFQRLVACGNLWITISKDKAGDPCRVFISGGKAGTCHANLEAMGRLLTLTLQFNKKLLPEIVDQLSGITCANCNREIGRMVGKGEPIKDVCLSCADAIGKELKGYVKEG